MANYQNSLGESELFGRMTAGFAKVCESVQSGKFVRDEMGVICESVCEDDENAGAAPEGETADAGATQDADVASATPEQINGSTENMSDKINAGYDYVNGDDGNVGESSEEEVVEEGAIGSTLGTIGGSIIGGAVGHPIIGGAVGGALGNRIGDAIHDKWHGNMGPYRKQSLKRDIAAGIGGAVGGFVGNLSPTLNGACASLGSNLGSSVVGKAVGAAAGAVAPTAAGAIAGKAVGDKILKTNESCVGKKPLKKLIPEGCCGGKKAKKVLKECGSAVVTEKKVPLCKTCGNPLDETGTCQDCQGYSEVKEVDGEIKLQVPADIRRRALLKNGAKDNQRKLACAIRDRKAVGIVKEGLDYHKNADKITKDDVFGMLVNLLYQIRDGVSVEDVTTNPDMDEFDDYSLDEVLELAKKYDV